MKVIAIQKTPVEQAVRALLRRSRQSDPRARDWALRRLVAGPWSGTFALEASHAGRARHLGIDRQDVPASETPPLVARRIGEGRDLGYLRLKNTLGDAGIVQHFDAALQHLKGTRGLVLDLRETQSGGSPAVARALLGRFVTAESPWILRCARGTKRGRGRGCRAGRAARALRLSPRARSCSSIAGPRGRRIARRRPRGGGRGDAHGHRHGRPARGRARAAAARVGHRPALSRRPASSTPTARRARSSARRCRWTSSAPVAGRAIPSSTRPSSSSRPARLPCARGDGSARRAWRPGPPSRERARRSARGSPPRARGCLRR